KKGLNETDAFLGMYHDQVLPVLKALSFGSAVNITLGIPIVRTSVDHGVALDMAGSGKSDTASLKEAIKIAKKII
ncbi:MAG: 4-hydroxythreonine-4-phosphate dehydrogenase PdxA, partial [Proteobacteria bacterium]|nr:4-hydroxythreonine-4-phosphate dehydrogenase PdxA [Pseudomonadota bacterium]